MGTQGEALQELEEFKLTNIHFSSKRPIAALSCPCKTTGMQEPSRSLASLSKESNPPQKRAAALGSYSSPDRATGLANGVIAVKQGSDTRKIFHPKY